MRLPRVAEPLRHRDFRLLWSGQTLTLLGTFAANVAYPFQVLLLGGSAIELGTLVSIYTLANLVFLLLGGAIADRVPRRTLIVAAETVSGVVVGIVSLLAFAGALRIWHLYVSMAFFGAATAFSAPALGAFIPELVPAEILVAGNALRGLSRQAARTAGPVVGGLLVGLSGPAVAFAFDGATFFVSAAAVALTAARPVARARRGSILGEIREGFVFVFSVQWLWVTIFGFSLVSAAFVAASSVGLPLLVTRVLGAGAIGYGVVTAAVGVGEALGATAIGQARVRRTGIVMFLFATAGGAGFLLYGLVPTLPGAIVASVVVGFSFVSSGVLWESALQRHVPHRLLGRVTSVDWFGGTLLAPLAPLAGAVVAAAAGPAALFVAAGAIAIALTLLGLLLPSIRRLE